jgi:hypothetical protein
MSKSDIPIEFFGGRNMSTVYALHHFLGSKVSQADKKEIHDLKCSKDYIAGIFAASTLFGFDVTLSKDNVAIYAKDYIYEVKTMQSQGYSIQLTLGDKVKWYHSNTMDFADGFRFALSFIKVPVHTMTIYNCVKQ